MESIFRLVALTLAVTNVAVNCDLPLDINVSNVIRNDDDTAYRLSEQILPEHYTIEITPYFQATANREAFTFDGSVTINVTVVGSGLSQVIIHENVREILALSITDSNGAPLATDISNPFERLRQYHFLQINLAQPLTAGETYNIRINYLGVMNETPLTRGVFRGRYRDSNGNTRWYAATHFQPTNARQAFPGFDEPGFKSTFDLIVNRPVGFTDTFANMPIAERQNIGDRVKEIFYTTPRMSTYLLTFHISEEFEAINSNNNETRSYRILARPNAQGQGDYAQEVGEEITTWLENYFDIPFYTMAEYMKNDQIASPDWASGATENWGLVSYRELRLLYEEGETNYLDKMYVATITAHELAHKWFGNLITCKWWDNIWINEGFASYFEYFATHGIRPEMQLDEIFNVMYLHSSLSSDASVSTPPLNDPSVNTPEQVTAHFGTITYAKGASLLRMLEHLVTPDTFKKALNFFLVSRSFLHAEPEHMYEAFSRAVQEDNSMNNFPGVDIAAFFRTWIDEAGYPVLNVNVNTETGVLELLQERFFISATATPTDQVWPIPISIITEGENNWDIVRPTYVMTTKEDSIAKTIENEWVLFNVKQGGIYRVNYDVQNWERIATALRNNIQSIHYLNRAQIVDDVFALMRAGRLDYSIGFNVISFLEEETSFFVWYPAITGFSWLRNRLLHMPEELKLFDEYLLNMIDAVFSNVGYTFSDTENLAETLNRFFVLSFACNIAHEGCINNAINQYSEFMNNGISVNPNLRRHVYCEGLRAGGYAEWQFLNQRRLTSNNQADEVVMLRALGCTKDNTAIQQYLNLILSDDVRAQDRVNAFTFLFMGDRNNARAALPFIRQNADAIRDAVVGSVRFNSVLANLAAYLDEDGLAEMDEWLNESQGTLPEYTVGASAISSALASMQWGTANADRILNALGVTSSSSVLHVSISLTVLASIFVFIR